MFSGDLLDFQFADKLENLALVGIHGELAKSLKGPIEACLGLKRLELSDFGARKDDPVMPSSKGLQELVLASNNWVADRYLTEVVLSFANLELLDISDCVLLTGGSIQNCADHESLRNLDLSGTNVDDVAVLLIAKRSKLDTLDISMTTLSDDGISAVIRMPTLKHLSVSGTCFGDRVINAESNGLAKLEVLRASWCKDISDSGVRVLVQKSHLKELEVYECDGISEDGKRALKWLFADRRLYIE